MKSKENSSWKRRHRTRPWRPSSVSACFQERFFPPVLSYLTENQVWGVKNPRPWFSALDSGEAFTVTCGLTFGRKHLGHLTMLRDISALQALGGRALIILNNGKGDPDLGRENGRELWDGFLSIWERVEPGNKLGIAQVSVDTEMEGYHAFERAVASHLSLGKVQQLYGWEPSEVKLSHFHDVSAMVATFLYATYHWPSRPSLCMVDKHQATHVEAAKIVASKMKIRFPSFAFRSLLPSLQGLDKRMSVKDEKSVIFLDEEPGQITAKLSRTITGGRDNLEEQKRLGGRITECVVFRLASCILPPQERESVANTCVSGELLCNTCKQNTVTSLKTALRG